jgi:hypothetical protein
MTRHIEVRSLREPLDEFGTRLGFYKGNVPSDIGHLDLFNVRYHGTQHSQVHWLRTQMPHSYSPLYKRHLCTASIFQLHDTYIFEVFTQHNMSPELIHRAEKRKLHPEHCVDVTHILRVRDDEQRNMAKIREVERRHVGGKIPGEDDCVVCSSIKGEAPNWLTFPSHKPRYDILFESLPLPVGIPTGPKASHRARSRSSPINIRALCAPHNRGLSTREVHELAVLQTRVDNAIAGTGPSLRLLTNIPKSIQLNIQQKQRVYEAQADLDLDVLDSKMGGGTGSVVDKAAARLSSQHEGHSRHDSDGWIILTLPPLHLADSIERSLLAESMLMEVNSLLSQLEKEQVKISFSAADRETLRTDI